MATKTKVISTTFKFRRGLAVTFQKNNPILAEGEPAFEKDTNKLKIGNGVDAWNDLPYITDQFIVSADGKSMYLSSDNEFSIAGFSLANAGQIPSKNQNGEIEWIDKSTPISIEDVISIIGEEE